MEILVLPEQLEQQEQQDHMEILVLPEQLELLV
jgi:hypothetical protein